jgi:hypothetical protein
MPCWGKGETVAMREKTWLKTNNYTRMMEQLGERLSKRKRLLFGCATARIVWDRLKWDCNRRAIEVTEKYADGLASREEVAQAYQNLIWEPAMDSEWHIVALTDGLPYRDPSDEPPHRLHADDKSIVEITTMQWADALRDLVGNPFRPLTIDPAWLARNDGAAVRLAQTTYEERRWEVLPVLADALEEAGCTEANLIAHCRQVGPHYRGCWAVDAVLALE